MRNERLNQIRLEKGIKIDELAEKTGIPKSTVSKICSGHTNTSYDNMAAIAHVLNCSLDDFSEYENTYISPRERAGFEKYKKMSEHGRCMVDRMMDIENHLTALSNVVQDSLLRVWVPITYMEDGMLYEGCNIRYLKVMNSEDLLDSDFGWKITSNAFMPVYFEGDILLVKYRFPRPGEVGLFLKGNLMYIRKYVPTRKHVYFCPVNIGEILDPAQEEEQFQFSFCAGTICGIFRGRILKEYRDKEGTHPM